MMVMRVHANLPGIELGVWQSPVVGHGRAAAQADPREVWIDDRGKQEHASTRTRGQEETLCRILN